MERRGNDLLTELLAFGFVSAVVVALQKFLFPVEDYWIALAAGLLAHSLVQWLLCRAGLIQNIFTALDDGTAQPRDALMPLLAAPAIAGALSVLSLGGIVFVFPVVLAICLLQSCTVAILYGSRASLRRLPSLHAGQRRWLFTSLVVVSLYGMVFLREGVYRPSHPLSGADAAVQGAWFTVPVPPSSLFPLGYARLEDSIPDDIGRVFVVGLGQSLGLVEACEIQPPDLANAIQSPAPDPRIQPKFRFASRWMCADWNASLPGFFWRIGLLGLLLLAFVLGAYLFQDPLDFAVMAILLLVTWVTWPQPELRRAGNAAVLLAAMPLIVLIFPLVRRGRYSLLIPWGLVAGVLFGLAGAVRAPHATALTAAAIAALLLAGLRQHKALLAVSAALTLMAGTTLVPLALNGLFIYRDAGLRIAAPRISPRVHGIAFPLLGGVGGEALLNSPEPGPEYENALDVAFLDGIIAYVAHDRNPLIGVTQPSYTLLQRTSAGLLWGYVRAHPDEFVLNAARKALQTLAAMLLAPGFWLALPLVLAASLARQLVPSRQRQLERPLAGERLIEVTLTFLVLTALTALPAVLTTPQYGQSAHPPAAVFFITLLIILQGMPRWLSSRMGIQ
jgi:hypothetical protein